MNNVTLLGLAVIAFVATIAVAALMRRKRRDQDPHSYAMRVRSDAKRLSRLLVSEIKLYNEKSLAEGRDEHDLYARLREDIDRARTMYEKRVNWLGVDRDYFHDAIVDILCDGDPQRLGDKYPGPRMPTVQ